MKYTEEQIKCLRDNYPISNYQEIEKSFPNLTKRQIVALANSYGIKQDVNYKLKKVKENTIGLCNVMCNGENAKIIDYISSSNITVQFDDGTIVTNKNLVDFKKGNIGKPIENRIGKVSKSNSGLNVTIIRYTSYRDIDIQFDDGTIVKHKDYGSFLRGEIAYPQSKRLGERKISNSGMLMTIIAYRNSNDIDIQFEDGTIVQHRDYRSFSEGCIYNPNFYKSKIGEEIFAPNGHTLKIIDYRNSKDVDVQFEDGTIVQHRDYYSFLTGNIAMPILNRVGQTNIAKNGMGIKIIAYRNSHDIDIQFEDGTIVTHKNYNHFLDGYIAYPRPDHVGEEVYAKNGMRMTLIAYRNVSDVDIKFEDGTIVEHKYYQNFKEGTILYPIENRIGYERIANNGLKMKIIAYRNSTDLDVEFEDGCIVTNKSFSDFKKGTIGHPSFSVHRSLPEKLICYFIGQYFSYIPNYKPLWLLNNQNVASNFRSEFDIFIPSHAIAIEYDGTRFHQNVTKDNTKNLCVNEHSDVIRLFIRIREEGCPSLKQFNNLKLFDIEPFYVSRKKSYSALATCISDILSILGISNPKICITKKIIDYCRSDDFYSSELDMLNNSMIK
jgi:uncharacterized protein YkvS